MTARDALAWLVRETAAIPDVTPPPLPARFGRWPDADGRTTNDDAAADDADAVRAVAAGASGARTPWADTPRED